MTNASELQQLAGTEHILVVDDEPLVRDVVAAQAQNLGYKVTSAADGQAALDVLEREPSIALMITDIVMPGELQGPALAERARELRPDVAVVFSSGHPRHEAMEIAELTQHEPFLAKPIRAIDLAIILRAVLDK